MRAKFTEEWARFEAHPPAQIKFQEVPWPPEDSRLLNVFAIEELNHAAQSTTGRLGKFSNSLNRTSYPRSKEGSAQ